MPPKKKQKSSSDNAKSPARVTRGSAAAKKKSVEEEAKTFVLGSPEPGATMKVNVEEDFSPIVQAALDAKPEAVAEKDSSNPDPPVMAAVAEDEKPPPHVDEIAAAAVAEAILDVDTGAVSLNKAGQPRKRKPRSKWSKEVSDSTAAAVSLFSRWRKHRSQANQLTLGTRTNLFFFRFLRAHTHIRRMRN